AAGEDLAVGLHRQRMGRRAGREAEVGDAVGANAEYARRSGHENFSVRLNRDAEVRLETGAKRRRESGVERAGRSVARQTRPGIAAGLEERAGHDDLAVSLHRGGIRIAVERRTLREGGVERA